ncbi:MAG: hypothetical protein HW416_2806 [Chloroflexi bacterium]|nr:hypothetical protein [Chloroflexota bacterium]
MQQAFDQSDADAFISHPYWAAEYVGLGPFRLSRWEPGAYIEGSAFEGHVLGRPRIDRVVVRFFQDENAALTSLLAGDSQYASGRSLRFEHSVSLRREWDSGKRGIVLLAPDTSRFVSVQFRPDVVAPRQLLDLRVRQAIVHAVNRDALNAGLFDGEAEMSDMFMTLYSRYERVQNMPRALAEGDGAITHYAYDERKTAQLMTRAGFARGRDRTFVNAMGDRFSLDVWTHASPQYEKELAILIDSWSQAGFDLHPTVLPAAALRDGQLRASFPGLYIASSSRLSSFTTSNISGPANRWSGNNRGGWSNPEYDRLAVSFNSTLDPDARISQVVQMLKLLSDELPSWVLYYNPSVAAHAAALRGPDNGSLNTDVWNVYEWELQ